MSATISHIEKKKSLAPKLRFKAFNKDWNHVKLGEVVSNESKKYNPLKNKTNYKCIELEHLSSNTGLLLGFSDSHSTLSIKNKFKKGDVLFGKLRPYLRKYLFTDFDGVCSSEIWVLRGSESDNRFLYFMVQTDKFIDLTKQSTGSKMPRADWNVISDEEFYFPSLLEQQKIASFLSAVDEKIQQLTRKKELLEQYKNGVMQQLFSGNLRFKDENGKAYSDWEEKRLGEVLEIGSGRDYKHLGQGNIPVFGTGGLMTRVDDFLYDGETVCIGRKGTIDKPMYHVGKIWTVDTLFYTHTFKNANPKFIFYVFQLINWKEHNEASGVPSLSKTTIEKLRFKFPKVEEQQKIASYLSCLDTKIESVATQIARSQTFKKGLLQQMFV